MISESYNLLWSLFKPSTQKKVVSTAPIVETKIPNTESYRTAVHESGHTITSWCCTGVDDVTSVEIYSNGTGGVTNYIYRFSRTPAYNTDIWWCLTVNALAGIAAEALIYGKVPAKSARSDLLKAVDLVRDIIKYNPDFYPEHLNHKSLDFSKIYTESTELTVKELIFLECAYKQAKEIILSYKLKFTKLILTLEHKKVLDNKQIASILGKRNPLILLSVFKTKHVYEKVSNL